MLELFMMQKYYMLGVGGLFICSNLLLILEYFIYQKLLRESDQITWTSNKTVDMKRFQYILQAYEEFKTQNQSKEVYYSNPRYDSQKCVNQKHFVDKYLEKIKYCGIKIGLIKHLSGQMALIGVMVSGFGACVCILNEKGIKEIIPFYVICFVGVYLYFAISSFVDLPEKRERLRTNILDYLAFIEKQKDEQKMIDTDMVWENTFERIEINNCYDKDDDYDMRQAQFSKKEQELFDLIDKIFLT